MMKLEEIRDILGAEVLSGNDLLKKEILIATGCDLLSDVLAFTEAGSMLITGLINPHVIRTAEMVDLQAICFVQNKKPVKSIIELAKEKDILCIQVGNKEELGAAAGLTVSTSSVAIIDEGEAKKVLKEISSDLAK